jgi:uncharacterized membrane protein YjjP (DUF1212 family)
MNFGKMMFNAMLGFVPAILIAWGYAKLIKGGWQDFWMAMRAGYSVRVASPGASFRRRVGALRPLL